MEIEERIEQEQLKLVMQRLVRDPQYQFRLERTSVPEVVARMYEYVYAGQHNGILHSAMHSQHALFTGRRQLLESHRSYDPVRPIQMGIYQLRVTRATGPDPHSLVLSIDEPITAMAAGERVSRLGSVLVLPEGQLLVSFAKVYAAVGQFEWQAVWQGGRCEDVAEHGGVQFENIPDTWRDYDMPYLEHLGHLTIAASRAFSETAAYLATKRGAAPDVPRTDGTGRPDSS